MADHLIYAARLVAQFICGNLNCNHRWEQGVPSGDLNDEAIWHVCPECLWEAPTNINLSARVDA